MNRPDADAAPRPAPTAAAPAPQRAAAGGAWGRWSPSAWAARGIRFPRTARHTFTWSGLVTAAAATAAAVSGQAAPVVVAYGVAMGALVLCVSTDLASQRIPREVPNTVAVIGWCCFAAHYSPLGAVAAAVTFIGIVLIPFIPTLVAPSVGIGFSDIRLLHALTASLAWWVGHAWMLYALVAAALIQILVRLTLRAGRAPLPFAPALAASYAVAATAALFLPSGVCGPDVDTVRCLLGA